MRPGLSPVICRPRVVRKVLGLLSAVAAGGAVAVVVAGSMEQAAEAGPTGRDGAASLAPGASPRAHVVAAGVDAVEPMCALLTSCDRLPIPSTLFPADFPACVKKMTDDMASPAAVQFSLTMRECGLRADSCASLRACALRGASPEACKGRGRQGVVGLCDVDGRGLTCWHDEILAVRDCNRGDEQCVVVDGQATCTLGSCAATAHDADRPRCSGSGRHLLRCDKGRLASLDCATFGLTCATDGEGVAGCATTGPVCSGAGRRCDGSSAVGCFNGHEVRIDCAAAGLSCAPSTDATAVGACAAGVPEAGTCDATQAAHCEGEVIRYCYAGRPRSYSCASLGFHRCAETKSGIRCTD
jgi:hypothetical protein